MEPAKDLDKFHTWTQPYLLQLSHTLLSSCFVTINYGGGSRADYSSKLFEEIARQYSY